MKITVHTGRASPAEMLALAAMLTTLANNRRPAQVPTKAEAEAEPVHVTPAEFLADDPATVAIAAPDTPAPAAVFGADLPTAEQVFTQAADSSTPTPAAATDAQPTMPTASEASASTSTASAAAVELDKDGLPWDARIHSGTRSKCADGSWKKKRNVPDAVVEQVTAALRQLMAVPGPVSTPTPTPAPVHQHVQTEAPAPTPEPVATATMPAPTADGAAPMPPFPALMRKITAAQTAGKLSPAQITQAVQAAGLNMLPDLLKRPDLIPQVEATIDSFLIGAPA